MPAIDSFGSNSAGLDTPAEHFIAVTPSDSVDLTNVSRGLYVGVAGDVKVTSKYGETVVLTALANGLYPYRVARVWATGTTATNIVAVY